VLDAERSLFDAELARARTAGVLFQALVNLYKAIGGGWVIEADSRIASDKDKKQTSDLNRETGAVH
jgi:multidrug efflux system outer membrane protein